MSVFSSAVLKRMASSAHLQKPFSICLFLLRRAPRPSIITGIAFQPARRTRPYQMRFPQRVSCATRLDYTVVIVACLIKTVELNGPNCFLVIIPLCIIVNHGV